MLLKFYYLWTAAVLRALGARRVRIEAGDTVVLASEIGPPDGEPWLLLHGLGATSLAWSPVILKLRRKVRMLIPELSSLGGTVTPGGGLNIAEGVDAVRALIQWWAPARPVTIAGISLGGWMAVRLALESPELVERLVLINAGGYRDQDWERIQELTDVSDMDDVDSLYQALFRETPFLLEMSRLGFLKAYSSPAVRYVLETTTEDHGYGLEELAALDKPTLLLWGEHDGLFRVDVARAMERGMPRARLVTLDAGHAMHWEKPRAIANEIERFRRESR